MSIRNKLSSQIPESYAANAFNVFQQSIHQFEIVRLCALWDSAELEKENIPTVVGLIDDAQVLNIIFDEVRENWIGVKPNLLQPSNDPELKAFQEQYMRKSKARRMAAIADS